MDPLLNLVLLVGTHTAAAGRAARGSERARSRDRGYSYGKFRSARLRGRSARSAAAHHHRRRRAPRRRVASSPRAPAVARGASLSPAVGTTNTYRGAVPTPAAAAAQLGSSTMALARRLGTWQLTATSTVAFGAIHVASAWVLKEKFAKLMARVREKDKENINWKVACRITAMLHALGICYLGVRRLASPGLKWEWLGKNASADTRILAFSLGFFLQVRTANSCSSAPAPRHYEIPRRSNRTAELDE
eukprot:SAG31_NODE_421_length_15868_cov_8.966453_9_plen_247_part_00